MTLAPFALALLASVTPTHFYVANLPPNTAYVVRVDDANGGTTLLQTHTWYTHVLVFTVGVDAGYVVQIISLSDTTITDIKPKTSVKLVRVYPNPTSGVLIVESPKFVIGEFTVYDVNHAVVMQRNLDARLYVIDVSSLPSGVYIYRTRNTIGKFVLVK